MRVLMFGWEFPPHNSGGLGVACKGIVQGLQQVGVDVTFVLPQKMKTDGALKRVPASPTRGTSSRRRQPDSTIRIWRSTAIARL